MFLEEKFIQFLHGLRLHRNNKHHAHQKIQANEVHEIYQTSTINALLEGVYDGEITYEQLRQHGDFGIGTFNGLDGEMVAVDGQFFQVKADGQAYPVDDHLKTPFAIVQYFKPEIQREIEQPLNYEQLDEKIDSIISSMNYFYAIRVDGFFSSIRLRSIPPQTKPYPSLVEITKTQPIFEFSNVAGTLVGFRFPDYARGVNIPGYHLHFLTADRKAGGHVLAFCLQNGILSVEHTATFHIELPTDGAFLEADLSKDQGEAIHQVEE